MGDDREYLLERRIAAHKRVEDAEQDPRHNRDDYRNDDEIGDRDDIANVRSDAFHTVILLVADRPAERLGPTHLLINPRLLSNLGFEQGEEREHHDDYADQ